MKPREFYLGQIMKLQYVQSNTDCFDFETPISEKKQFLQPKIWSTLRHTEVLAQDSSSESRQEPCEDNFDP